MSDRFYATVRTLSLPFLKGWIRLRIQGLEHIPSRGSFLVVANHGSYLDPVVLGRACPRKIHFFIKRSVWSARGLSWFFRGMDSIPVAADGNDTSSLRAALRYLEAGQVVGIFPEGGRAADGRLGDAKIGAALMASRSQCMVLPAGIRGAFAAMPTGVIVPRPKRIEVEFGKPFKPAPGRGRRHLDEIAERMSQEIEQLMSPGTPDRGRG